MLYHVLERTVQILCIFHSDAFSLGEKRSSTKLEKTSLSTDGFLQSSLEDTQYLYYVVGKRKKFNDAGLNRKFVRLYSGWLAMVLGIWYDKCELAWRIWRDGFDFVCERNSGGEV